MSATAYSVDVLTEFLFITVLLLRFIDKLLAALCIRFHTPSSYSVRDSIANLSLTNESLVASKTPETFRLVKISVCLILLSNSTEFRAVL